MFKRFFLVSSALLFGVLSVSSLLTANASAAQGIFDEIISPINNLTVETNLYGVHNGPLDVTSTFLDFVVQCAPDVQADFLTARASGSWAVTQNYDNQHSTLPLSVSVFWSSTSSTVSAPAEFSQSSGWSGQSGTITADVTGQYTISFPQGVAQEQPDVYCTDSVSTRPLASFANYSFYRAQHYVRPFASTYIVNYPLNYTGQDLPAPPSLLPDFVLPVSFTVEDKRVWVTLAPFAFPDKMPTENYAWRYSVFIKKGDDVLFQKTFLRFPETVSVEYTIDGDYGEYTLVVKPENFGPPAVNVSDFYNLVTTTIPLDVNGSTYIVNPDDLVCDATGQCTKPSVYADCNQFNTQVTILGSDPFYIPSSDSFVCIFNNFGTFLRVTSISFFVPRQSYLSAISTNSNEWFLGQFGMVKQSFDYTYQFASSQLSVTPNCTLSVPSVTFFGAPVNWNFCTFENEAPNVYNVAINFARAVLATMMLLALAYRLTHLIDEFRS